MEERILVWAVGRDGPLSCAFLQEAGFVCRACSSSEELRAELAAGAGVLILAAELLSKGAVASLEAVLGQQSPWSDLPLIIVAGIEPAADAIRDSFDGLGNVSLLHRSLSLDTLASTARTAL